jgi:hypothetical protein
MMMIALLAGAGGWLSEAYVSTKCIALRASLFLQLYCTYAIYVYIAPKENSLKFIFSPCE